MNQYYKMEFTSPQPLYAEIKEMLKTYFDSGAVDDLMFPVWTEYCIKKFRRSLLRISETALHVVNFEATLPDNFKYAREVWACTTSYQSIQSPNSLYYQKDCRVGVVNDSCEPCFDNNSQVPKIPCDSNTCSPCNKNYVVTHKRTNETLVAYSLRTLLKPGNIHTKNYCSSDCANLNVRSVEVFDIRDCKLITNFEEGWVHLIYYADEYEGEEILIPDNIIIKDFIRYYIIYKIFETLSNQISDESLNQIMNKMAYYERKKDEAYILADIETKKETIWDVNKKIVQTHRRYRNYNIR